MAPTSASSPWALVLGALFVCGLASAYAFADNKPNPSRLSVQPIDIQAERIAAFDKVGIGNTKFGELEFLSGLRLSSKNRSFGGWSGLAIDSDGQGFIAVSDAGTWLTGQFSYDGDRLGGVGRGKIGPLLALNGRPLRRGRDRDAEAITFVRGSSRRGNLLIAFEQNHRIGRFKATADGPGKPTSYVMPRRPGGRMRALKGFEAISVLKGGAYDGSLVAIAERKHDSKGRHTGWIWVKGRPRTFKLLDMGGLDITDAVALDDGGLLVLERRFRWLEGLKIRVRHIAADELKPGAVITGRVLMEAGLAQTIDNLEGLAVHPHRDGGLVLTMMSDDNFNSVLQQNLVLQFLWRRSAAS
ncbi:MAG: esterase-like activity of phytase family protein [Pseudomonadota bacterium]